MLRTALASLLLALPLGAQSTPSAAATTRAASRAPNELGRIPVLEYHLIGERDSRWSRNWERFARDLELLHARGYRPITVRQMVSGDFDLPAGLSPVVITFDDASPGQFRYIEDNGQLKVDPRSAVGIWDAFAAKHPEWKGRGTFCVLTAANEGHALFGDELERTLNQLDRTNTRYVSAGRRTPAPRPMSLCEWC
jgi:hypothetical protein